MTFIILLLDTDYHNWLLDIVNGTYTLRDFKLTKKKMFWNICDFLIKPATFFALFFGTKLYLSAKKVEFKITFVSTFTIKPTLDPF